jgi:hypothetical protein
MFESPRTSVVVKEVVLMALTNRGKNVVRGFAVASLLVVIGAGFSAVGSSASEKVVPGVVTTKDYVRVVVAPGETLWSVAALVAGSSDVAAVVDEIVSVNHLSSSSVAAGTRLLVPLK